MYLQGEWQVQEAKNRLSALLADAGSRGPQAITRHGKPIAVVLSFEDFERMADAPKTSLLEFFANSPLSEIEIDDRDPGDVCREVTF